MPMLRNSRRYKCLADLPCINRHEILSTAKSTIKRFENFTFKYENQFGKFNSKTELPYVHFKLNSLRYIF